MPVVLYEWLIDNITDIGIFFFPPNQKSQWGIFDLIWMMNEDTNEERVQHYGHSEQSVSWALCFVTKVELEQRKPSRETKV